MTPRAEQFSSDAPIQSEPIDDKGLRSFTQWAKGTGAIWGEHSSQITRQEKVEVVDTYAGEVACQVIEFYPLEDARQSE